MKHTIFWARFFLAATIATAALIFWFSAQKGAGSQALSDSLTRSVARVLRPDYMQLSKRARFSYLHTISIIIRKNAHFCEYMLLGFCLMGTFRFYFPALSDGGCRLRAMVIAALYAASDELHQLFVANRSSRALDVLIDCAGSLAGTLVFALCLALLVKLRQRRARR